MLKLRRLNNCPTGVINTLLMGYAVQPLAYSHTALPNLNCGGGSAYYQYNGSGTCTACWGGATVDAEHFIFGELYHGALFEQGGWLEQYFWSHFAKI
jgi:hypothetical protein